MEGLEWLNGFTEGTITDGMSSCSLPQRPIVQFLITVTEPNNQRNHRVTRMIRSLGNRRPAVVVEVI